MGRDRRCTSTKHKNSGLSYRVRESLTFVRFPFNFEICPSMLQMRPTEFSRVNQGFW